MIAPRWRKLWRDARLERGRVLLMIVAVWVSVTGLGVVLGARAILSREMPASYLETRPASATLELPGGVSRELVEEVRRRADVAEAEAGDVVLARAKVGEDWIPLLLFVADDFERIRLNRIERISGAWPPPEGTMLVERSAVLVLGASEGGEVLVKPPRAGPRSVAITGLVHDPGVAPAWQERVGYGYVTRATLAGLGEPEVHELRLTTKERPLELAAVEAVASSVARSLVARGIAVEEVRIPPPGQHPHQTQMNGVTFLLLAFTVMSLVLSGVLVATSVSAMLGRQVREIGVMKTTGARASQLASLYLCFVALLGVLASLPALPAGALGAVALAKMSGAMLNLTLASTAIPPWVFVVQAFAGVVVPLLVACGPVVLACRVSVRDAMDRHGASQPPPRGSWLTRLTRSRRLSATVRLALRNAFRRRLRFALAVALLAAGGAMFVTAIDVARGWQRVVDRVYENRHYDVEVRLNAPAAVADSIRALPGVRSVEAWGYARAAASQGSDVDIVRTYPDGGHGSLSVMGVPVETRLVEFPLLSGRWLRPGDAEAVVLNHMALAQLPGVRVGDTVSLSLEGRPMRKTVVGIVEEVGSPGIAYVPREAFARATAAGDATRLVRVVTDAVTPEARLAVIRSLERLLEARGASVEMVLPLSVLRTAMGDHVVVLIRLLLAMAALMLAVAVLGLVSTIGSNVLERTRELGVLRTAGATSWQIVALVIGEAMTIALVSAVAAALLAVPLTLLVGTTVGRLAFRVGLPFVIDAGAVAGWLVIVVGCAGVAALLPARRAARLTVRDALAEV